LLDQVDIAHRARKLASCLLLPRLGALDCANAFLSMGLISSSLALPEQAEDSLVWIWISTCPWQAVVVGSEERRVASAYHGERFEVGMNQGGRCEGCRREWALQQTFHCG
jgi:hypothetical protein